MTAEAQAYGKILEGGIALAQGDARAATKLLTEANTTLDTWLGHFDLGRAFLALRAFPAEGRRSQPARAFEAHASLERAPPVRKRRARKRERAAVATIS